MSLMIPFPFAFPTQQFSVAHPASDGVEVLHSALASRDMSPSEGFVADVYVRVNSGSTSCVLYTGSDDPSDRTASPWVVAAGATTVIQDIPISTMLYVRPLADSTTTAGSVRIVVRRDGRVGTR